MLIIAPLKSFLVDFQINNPSDTDTHYVRAVIKNSVSGAIIDTINLTDNGSGYFSKLWTTPADQSGSGLQISILRTVYDDSGYTSQSLVYGTQLETYIVRDLPGLRSTFGGSGSGAPVSYEEIERIIRKVLKELPQPEKIVIPDHSKEILEALNVVNKKLASLITNLKAKTDNKDEGIEDLKKMIHTYSEAQKVLIGQLTKKVDGDLVVGISEGLIKAMEGLQDKNLEKFAQLIKAVNELANKVTVAKLLPEREKEIKPEVDPVEIKEVRKFKPREVIQKLLSFTI